MQFGKTKTMLHLPLGERCLLVLLENSYTYDIYHS